MKFNSDVYDALIDALLAVEISDHTIPYVAENIINNSNSEEEIIKKINSFGRIIGHYAK